MKIFAAKVHFYPETLEGKRAKIKIYFEFSEREYLKPKVKGTNYFRQQPKALMKILLLTGEKGYCAISEALLLTELYAHRYKFPRDSGQRERSCKPKSRGKSGVRANKIQ